MLMDQTLKEKTHISLKNYIVWTCGMLLKKNTGAARGNRRNRWATRRARALRMTAA